VGGGVRLSQGIDALGDSLERGFPPTKQGCGSRASPRLPAPPRDAEEEGESSGARRESPPAAERRCPWRAPSRGVGQLFTSVRVLVEKFSAEGSQTCFLPFYSFLKQ